MKYFILFATLFISSIATAPMSYSGQGLLNKLLSPGPLIEGHKNLEFTSEDCLKCHKPSEGIPNSKCLDCHKEIKESIAKKKSFHGLAQKTCHECHSDHKGREFDSTKIDEKKFDHKQTGYILEGKHADIDCVKCHIEKRSKAKKAIRPNDTHYFGLKTNCVSCHKKDDVHFFKGKFAQKDCSACHGLKEWKKDLNFDHNKDTKYKIDGAHSKVKCSECHTPKNKPSIYEWPNLKRDSCLACHADQHRGKLSLKLSGGQNCTKCHSIETWKIENFKHKEITGYALEGKHSQIKCLECHKQAEGVEEKGLKHFKFTGLRTDCLSCHKDQHRGNFSEKFSGSKQCLKCHNMNEWKIPRFDHSITGYKLKEKHAEIKCIECHKQKPEVEAQGLRSFKFQGLKKDCTFCHKDIHMYGNIKPAKFRYKIGECLSCHNETAWKQTHDFDHNINTNYPIIGKHEGVKCEKCHVVASNNPNVRVYRYPTLKEKTCELCHKNPHLDAPNPRTFAGKCSNCHNEFGWNVFKKAGMKFDHNTQTRFKIDGSHSSLKCNDCHMVGKKQVYRFANKGKEFCIDCHKNVHDKQFNRKFADKACSECHTTTNFMDRKTFDHDTTSYALTGKHIPVKCDKCHTQTKEVFDRQMLTDAKATHAKVQYMSKFKFPELGEKNCKSCHKDPHDGDFGPKCSECHTTNDWKKVGDFHKNFTLSGVHFSLECTECHKNGRRLSGMSDNCVLCHQKDDIHNGTLPNCKDCHKQQFWENVDFKHSMTMFPLRGVHRTLDCYSCHNRNNYKGLPNRCVDCHRQDALSFTGSPNHTLLISRDCFDCHNQFSFK